MSTTTSDTDPAGPGGPADPTTHSGGAGPSSGAPAPAQRPDPSGGPGADPGGDPSAAGWRTLDARLARIEAQLDRLSAAFDQIPPVPATLALAGDAFDAWAAEQQRRGLDLDGHVATASRLAERLTDPKVSAQLERLAALTPKLVALAEVAATFESSTAMFFDSFDEYVRRLDARGVNVEERFRQATRLLERLTEPELQARLEELLELGSGGLEHRPLGLLGLLQALSNPDVQRAVGLAVALAERVGRRLPGSSSVPAPRSR